MKRPLTASKIIICESLYYICIYYCQSSSKQYIFLNDKRSISIFYQTTYIFVANKHRKIWLILLVIGECKIKTVMGYYTY